MGFGGGYYGGRLAGGFTIAHRPSESLIVSAGIATGGNGRPVARAQIAVAF